MQGQVTVPYTGIGGTNMDSGIMPAISGSSGGAEGEHSNSVTLAWELPGGISGMKFRGGAGHEWGYLRPGQYTTDADVIEMIKGQEQFSGVEFDSEGNLMTTEYAPQIEAYLNSCAYDYVTRLMSTGDYSDFRDYFGLGTCVFVSG